MFKLKSPLSPRIIHAIETVRVLHAEQTYGGKSYFDGHILPCLNVAIQLTDDPNWLIAVIFHDAFEDTFWKTSGPDDIKKDFFGKIGIEAAAACADGPGKNRKERKAHAYAALQHTVVGRFAKLVDRYCNVASGGKAEMYVKEHGEFRNALYKQEDCNAYPHIFPKLWESIETRLEINKEKME